MSYSASDFLGAFQALLPVGAVWSRDPSSVQSRTLATLMPTWARLAARDENLLVDAFPATTVELLPEWEATLGLPDPCAGASPTLQERQAQVLARFANSGGQSAAYFIGYAANLGYAISITQFAPAVAGRLRAGQPCYGRDWAFAWQVNVPGSVVTYFRAGQSAAGEPLEDWNNRVLECELRRIAPAHTVVLFAQISAGTASLGELTFGLDALGG